MIYQDIIDPYWIVGFTSAEGSFLVKLMKSSAYKTGTQVQLEFNLTQHLRDERLIRSFIEYYGCGSVYKDKETFHYRVSKFIDIYEKIIPFFCKHSVLGKKFQDFKDFCKVAEIIKAKDHLTASG